MSLLSANEPSTSTERAGPQGLAGKPGVLEGMLGMPGMVEVAVPFGVFGYVTSLGKDVGKKRPFLGMGDAAPC